MEYTSSVKVHRINVDGAEIQVFDWPAAKASAPSLLLVHGYRANAHWWDAIVEALRGKFRIILPEFSGMGGSDCRESYQPNQGAIDVAGVIQGLDLQLDWVIAHSWGGHQMAKVVRMMPERFARLIMVDSFFMVNVDEEIPAGAAIGNTREYDDKEDAIARFRTSPRQPIPEHIRRNLADKSLCRRGDAWVWSYDPGLPVLTPEPDDEALLKNLPVTSHYLLAGQSPVVGPARAERIAALAKCETYQIIPDGHHHLMLDSPAQMLGVLHDLNGFMPE